MEKQDLSVITVGVQQTVVDELIDKHGDDSSRLVFLQNDAILNIGCNVQSTSPP